MVPKNIFIKVLLARRMLFECQNSILAVGDHLVSNLNEEACHSVISIVVSSYSMNHLDTVHQGW